jgi:hypothetical protein
MIWSRMHLQGLQGDNLRVACRQPSASPRPGDPHGRKPGRRGRSPDSTRVSHRRPSSVVEAKVVAGRDQRPLPVLQPHTADRGGCLAPARFPGGFFPPGRTLDPSPVSKPAEPGPTRPPARPVVRRRPSGMEGTLASPATPQRGIPAVWRCLGFPSVVWSDVRAQPAAIRAAPGLVRANGLFCRESLPYPSAASAANRGHAEIPPVVLILVTASIETKRRYGRRGSLS